uniref:Protection of telomeres protein 1 n=1 Tax=Echinococcus granulosus TaxID=6210 RepID=A0A068WPK2_ECHGR|nr:protection of telomeres protein 1 [Echinococcus granulosus]
MASSDVPPQHQYEFVDLRNITEGRHNIIAVVKFFKPPQKTRGSGFSMFVSISDPSLKGDKFSVTVINNNVDKLPPIHSPGDIVIMHRLSVSTFRGRLQGYGSENAGFAVAVFPGTVDSSLAPYESTSTCTFTDKDLSRVKELRTWYNSPECPLEKEAPQSLSPYKAQAEHDTHNLSRIHSVKVNSFFNTEAQVVAIYTYPTEVTNDLILCLWDGEPPRDDLDLFPFYKLSDLEHPPSQDGFQMDPRLICITRHSFLPEVGDWSVCVFIFDEHAESVRSLKPGTLIRLHNLHCTAKCDPDKRKVDMHGGGHRYGRRIELLTEETASADLLERLRLGRMARQPLNAASLSQDMDCLRMLTAAQFYVVFNGHNPTDLGAVGESSSSFPVRIRFCGWVVDVVPSKSENILNHFLLKCGTCCRIKRIQDDDRQVANWLTGSHICECESTSSFDVLPVFLLELADFSGRVIAVSSTCGVEALIGAHFPSFRACLRTVFKGATVEERVKAAEEIKEAWTACVGGWVDATLLVLQNSCQSEAKVVYLEG